MPVFHPTLVAALKKRKKHSSQPAVKRSAHSTDHKKKKTPSRPGG